MPSNNKDTVTKHIGTDPFNLKAAPMPDSLEEALTQLTSEDYNLIYTTYKKTEETKPVSNDTALTDDNNIQRTGSSYSAWDPRLSRVDGFVTNKDDDNPLIVPFASNTAAGAFFDMVFTVENKIAENINKSKNEQDNENTRTQEPKNANTNASGEDIKGTSKTYNPESESAKAVVNMSNSFGVSSLVNPYTLTKLCGGLTKTGDQNNASFDNHMYDVRDNRRFYDMSVTGKQGSNHQDVLSINNPTTTNIITYSNRDPWGRTPYYFQDFVFCKYWNIIPNNHLVTLRKYHAPVYDNLQFTNMFTGEKPEPFSPIATVVSYFGEDTGNTLSQFFSFSTGTNWKDLQAKIHDVSGNEGSNPQALIDGMFEGNNGFSGAESNFFGKLLGGTNWVTGKMFSFGKFVGLLSPDGYKLENDQKAFEKMSQANIDPSESLYENKIKGPVNRIDSTKQREAGIKFDQKLSLTCQYVARPIGGVNTKAAMLDILSNCMEMASVDAMFWGGGYRFNVMPSLYPFKNNRFKNRIMDDLYKGKIFGKNGALAHTVDGVRSFGQKDGKGEFSWSNVTESLGNVLGNTLGAIGEMLNSVSNVVFGSNSSLGSWLKGAGNNVGDGSSGDNGAKKMNSLFNNVNQMWRSQVIQRTIQPQINGMRALLTGEPVGNWHLTVGNPLNPIMVIGNLICTDMKVECGEELGPDDFPLDLKVVYTIEHAMPRDKSSIQSMFNRGGGRIYQLPDWMRASSDYESKVDDFTGPGDNPDKWYTPQYMNVNKMVQQGGGVGFQKYKMSNPTLTATNAHTDMTIITKFTPPDVDAAISNIGSTQLSFFGVNPTSRAWIRGTTATRKLMN